MSIGYLVNNHLHQALHRSGPVDAYLLHLLLYADDIVLLATSIDALTRMSTHLNAICEDLGLAINLTKVEVQGLGRPTPGQQTPCQLSTRPTSSIS
eukprot:355878-Chlamydomonas_euryale.AAC.1